MIYKFSEWLAYREAQGVSLGTYSMNDYEAEAAEDAEAAYNQVVKMSSEPTRTARRGTPSSNAPPFQWLHYMNNYLATMRDTFIKNAAAKIMKNSSVGFSRYKARKIAQNYIMGELQKGPISRKTAEFGNSLGYTPTMTVSPQTVGYTTQSFDTAPQTPVSQHFAGSGIYKPAARGPKSKFKTEF